MVILAIITLILILFIDKLVYKFNNIKIDVNTKTKIFLVFFYISGLFFSKNMMLYTVVFNVIAHIALIDEKEKIIPDKYIFILLCIGVIKNLYNGSFKHIIVSAIIYIFSIVFIVLMEKIKLASLGGGDLKLLFSLNILFGVKSMLVIFFFTCLSDVLGTLKKSEKYTALGKYFLIGFVTETICKEVILLL